MTKSPPARKKAAPRRTAAGRSLALRDGGRVRLAKEPGGETITVVSADGGVRLEVLLTTGGTVLRIAGPKVSIEAEGELALRCARFEVQAEAIALGKADLVVTGGAEVLSDVPIQYGRRFRDALFAASKGRTAAERLRAFRGVKLKDLAPVAPAIAEPSTGQTMGQSAEKMAKVFGIRREDQDAFAAQSHRRASEAWQSGAIAARVVPVPVPSGKELRLVERDDHPRDDTTAEKLAKLRPVFDREYGSVTAGNASPLTDGASAVLLAAEEVARAEGWPILGRLRSYHYTAIDPFEHLLMGPVSAVAGALDQAGLGLREIGVIEMHEAFAAQVLANIQGLGSAKYCAEKLGRSAPVGEIDPTFVNQWGGSVSLGHPFGATGGRLVLQLLDQMARKQAQFGLISACAAGGMGSSMVFEAV